MTQRTLLQLLPTPRESDYLDHFQCLASVNVEIQKRGATAERLLRKAMLEMQIGNYAAGLRAAKDASELRPVWAEAHYQQGMAYLHLAFVRSGILAAAPDMDRPTKSARTLLQQAGRAFGEALRLHPDDGEAKEDLKCLSTFLAMHSNNEAVIEAMKELQVS